MRGLYMKSIYYSIALLLLMFLSGCGSEGGNIAAGKTVNVYGSIKSATSNWVFATMSTTSTGVVGVGSNYVSFHFESNPYPGTTSIKPSPVMLTSFIFTFAPQSYVDGIAPAFISDYYGSYKSISVPVPAGTPGSADFENLPVLSPIDAINICSNLPAPSMPVSLVPYAANATFRGYEVNTSEGMTVNIPFMVTVTCK
jgi:hypothetical protein